MAVNFAPILAETPQSGANRGLSLFSNALDAVLQRRAQQQQHEAQLAAEAQRQQILDTRERERIAGEQEHARALEQQARINAEQARQHQKAEEDRADQARRAGAIKDAATMFSTPGQESAGLARLQADNIGITPKAVDPTLQQPIAQAPEAGQGAGADWAARAYQEKQTQDQELARRQELAQAEAQASGKYNLDFGGGHQQELDVNAMGPAGQAERIRAMLPHLDPAAAAAASRIAALQGAGMMKPEAGGAMVESAVGRGENNVAAMERARVTAAGRDQIKAGEAGRLTQQQNTGFEGAYGNWEKAANVDKLTDAKTFADQATGLLEQFKKTGASQDQKAALYMIAKQMTGPGVLTDKEYERTATNNTGILGLLQSKASVFAQGKISDIEMAALEQYIKDSQQIIRQKAAANVQNYDNRFGPKTQYGKNIPDDVAAVRKTLIDRFGLQPSDLEGHKRGKSGAAHITDQIMGGGQ
jgi:hypothetical protein